MSADGDRARIVRALAEQLAALVEADDVVALIEDGHAAIAQAAADLDAAEASLW